MSAQWHGIDAGSCRHLQRDMDAELVSSDAQQSFVCWHTRRDQRQPRTSFGRPQGSETKRETPINVNYMRVGCYPTATYRRCLLHVIISANLSPARPTDAFHLFLYFQPQTNNSFTTSRPMILFMFLYRFSVDDAAQCGLWTAPHVALITSSNVKNELQSRVDRPSFLNEFRCDQWITAD